MVEGGSYLGEDFVEAALAAFNRREQKVHAFIYLETLKIKPETNRQYSKIHHTWFDTLN